MYIQHDYLRYLNRVNIPSLDYTVYIKYQMLDNQ